MRPGSESDVRHTLQAGAAPQATSPLLTVEEVRLLWSFVHGDIMEPGIRVQLRSSLGLCPRHTWAYAIVEIELWQTGAGVRAGHQPFDVTVLYEDLLDHVAGRLSRPATLFHPHPESVLKPTGPCRLCADLAQPGPSGKRLGYAASNSEELAREANELTWTRRWCTETWPVWRSRVCPMCDDPHAPGDREADRSALMCRIHLLRPARESETLRRDVAARLLDLRDRMHRLNSSMTQGGGVATPADDSSWIETLGFFAGWSLPLGLVQIPDPSPERFD